jgi:cytochrome P450
MTAREIPTLGAPPIWQLAAWLTDPARLLGRTQAKLGPVFRLRIARWADLVIVARPDLLPMALEDGPGRLETGAANALMAPVVGADSIFVRDGGAHRALRRDLARLFSRQSLHALEGDLDRIVAQQLSLSGARLDAEFVLRHAACAAVWQVISGRPADDAASLARPLAQALGPRAAIAAFCGEPISGWVTGPVRRALDRLDAIIFDEIDRQAHDEVPRGGLIGALLQDADASDPAVRTRIRDNAVSLLAAGGDTTASAGAWLTALALGRATPVWEAIRAAVEADNIPYLESCAQEALRLGPVVEVVSRRAAVDMSIGEFQVRQGDFVSACPYLAHRDPAVYPNPLSFEPARFIDGPPAPHLYFPFGGGARRCIGAPLAMAILTSWMRALAHSPYEAWQGRNALAPARRNVTLAPRAAGRLVITNAS